MTGAPNFGAMPVKDTFMELMADSAQAVINHFGNTITFINVLRNMSVDCDCAGTSAQKPTMKNIGILASNDLLAIDQPPATWSLLHLTEKTSLKESKVATVFVSSLPWQKRRWAIRSTN